MFDLRYHVASLAAVFLALIVGIVVGVGMADRGFLRSTERKTLEREIRDLNREVDDLRRQRRDDTNEREAADALLRETYPQLVQDRLRGKRVAMLFVGPVDGRVRDDVERALGDASAALPIMRLRAIRVPVDVDSLGQALEGRPALASYAGDDDLTALGRELGEELAGGGETPLWDELASELVEERAGTARRPADAVVLARSAEPQRGQTERFLDGLYSGLASSGVPVVGVERSRAKWSAVAAFARPGISTVDSIDTLAGRAALVLLVAGATPGDYGFKQTAESGVVPPVDSVPEPTPARD